jgi:hypothetical protein
MFACVRETVGCVLERGSDKHAYRVREREREKERERERETNTSQYLIFAWSLAPTQRYLNLVMTNIRKCVKGVTFCQELGGATM